MDGVILMNEVSVTMILRFAFLFVILALVCKSEATADDALLNGDVLRYEKPDVRIDEYALIGDAVRVYDVATPGVLSLPCNKDESFDSLLLVTDIGPDGGPQLPYRFIIEKPAPDLVGPEERRIVVEKTLMKPEAGPSERGLARRLLLSDAYLSDDEEVMSVIRRIKRPMETLPYAVEAQETDGAREKRIRIRSNVLSEFVVGSAQRPRLLRASIEGIGAVDDIRWENTIGAYNLCDHGAKVFTLEQDTKKFCFYGKYYHFIAGKGSFDFKIHCCIFDSAMRDLRKSRAEFYGVISGTFDVESGEILGLKVLPDDGVGVAVEKRSMPFVSVENGMMLETINPDGSRWRKGRPDGKVWFDGAPTQGVFTWSVPVLVYRNVKIALDHNYPDSLEGEYMIKKVSGR